MKRVPRPAPGRVGDPLDIGVGIRQKLSGDRRIGSQRGMMVNTGAAAAEDLRGIRVFLVEDESLIMMLLEDIMTDLEIEVVRSALTLKEALDAALTVDAQAAILDINLAGDPIFPVAERLAARGIPLIFASGYGATTLPDAWKNRTTLPKPFSAIQVEAALRTVLGFATA